MLTEYFVAGTESVKPPVTHLSSALKDVGVFLHEFQPQVAVRQGFKKSSIGKNCLAVSDTHVFAAQVGKAVINVYNREKNNQESTVPFPQKISSIAYAPNAAILVIGTQDGRLLLWEIATGRITNSSGSHIEPVTFLEVSLCGEFVISASPDSSIHIWSIQNLVSIGIDGNQYGNKKSKNEPAATFTHHRSAVEALSIGHVQQASSNIVASASEDKTCYIWNLESLTIMRTVLLQQSPQCAVFDPADRAVYFGSSDGSVQMVDILQGGIGSSETSILATSQRDATTATQLSSRDCWAVTGSSGADPAQCITISYDGSSLITGHYSGCLIEWDIGKRRMGRQLSTLTGQSITNVQILRPLGLGPDESRTKFLVPTVIKPRLEVSQAQEAQSNVLPGVPADYTFHTRVIGRQLEHGSSSTITRMLSTPEIPQTMLDDAVQSLLADKVARAQTRHPGQIGQANGDVQQLDDIQKELVALQAKLARREELDQVRLEKHVARIKQRETLGLQKRQAFFAARKQGKNGDDAMKLYDKIEQGFDQESDDEAVAAVAANGERADVAMKDQ